MTQQELFNAMTEAFDAGRSVFVVTSTRATEFKPKYRAMLKPSTDGKGFRMQRGKAWDYVFPENIRIQ